MKSSSGLNNENPGLLYEQIKAGIKESIRSETLKPGEKLPTETELCEIYNVSRITVRRAIKELVEEGVIEVIRGKGTFVKAVKTELHLLNLKGYTEGLSSTEKHIDKEILHTRIVRDEPEVSKAFSFKYNEFLELVRLVKDTDGPFSIDYAYLPLELYPGIEELINDEVSTFELIRKKYGIKFAKVTKEIEYIHPSPIVCQHLGVSKNSVVILVKKIIYSEEGSPVHYSKYCLLGDKVKFFIEGDYVE